MGESFQDMRKREPIDLVKVGSVSIPIYHAPVLKNKGTGKVCRKPQTESAANGSPYFDPEHHYDSYVIYYYEG